MSEQDTPHKMLARFEKEHGTCNELLNQLANTQCGTRDISGEEKLKVHIRTWRKLHNMCLGYEWAERNLKE